MSTHSYARKTYNGGYASPTQGSPNLNARIASALPGKQFVARFIEAEAHIIFQQDLTPGEITTLDAEYAAWTPTSRSQYQPFVKVETPTKGKTTLVDWYEDSARTKLSKQEVRNFQGTPSRWMSTTITEYYTDGTTASVKTETYTTLTNGSVVTEVS